MNIFVYGSLKPGEFNYQTYCQGKTIKETPAYVHGKIYDLGIGYPALTEGNDRVFGYVLSFEHDQILAALDRLEDFVSDRDPELNEYQRCPVTAYDRQNHGPIDFTWVYRMAKEKIKYYPQAVYLPEGEWFGPN
ncbi:MAG: gamma-glutamylcyclotransferase [Synechococcaceae cyanobacterium RL_1_2]|nr:gamma-glutamylcyclotransferase [Synechococcaceae cyanobacterium RL_1_2]